MDTQQINVKICTIPQEACDASKANWQQTVQMVSRQIKTKFGELVKVQHIEFMSPEWFQNEPTQKLLENGKLNFPFVLVNDEVACADKKINISKINRAINKLISI